MYIDYAAMLVLTEENRAVAAATAAQPAVQTAQAAADANADPAEPEGKGGGGASAGLRNQHCCPRQAAYLGVVATALHWR